MKKIKAYSIIQLKRSVRSIQKGWIGTLFVFLIVGILSFMATCFFVDRETYDKAQVGVVIPPSETLTQLVFKTLSAMESVDSVSDFVFIDDIDEAVKKLESNKLQAIIEIPNGFYEAVDSGINPPATLYLPADPTERELIFEELIRAGVSYLQVGEACVYATFDAGEIFDISISYDQIGNTIAFLFAEKVLERDDTFKEVNVSPFEGMATDSFYYVAAVLLILSFSSIRFTYLFEKENKNVEKMLRIKGIGGKETGLVKFCIIYVREFILTLVLYACGLGITKKWGYIDLWWNVKAIGMCALLALAVSTYVFFLWVIAGDERNGVGLVMGVSLFMALLSGVCVPSVYFPKWMQSVGRVMPMKLWADYSQGLFSAKSDTTTLMWMLVSSLVLLALGVLFSEKLSRGFLLSGKKVNKER